MAGRRIQLLDAREFPPAERAGVRDPRRPARFFEFLPALVEVTDYDLDEIARC
jgi:hypothetical protein